MQEKTIGNFLEKPTVLLKRNYIRDTTFNEEKLAEGSKYDRVEVQAQSLAKEMAAGSLPPPPPGFGRYGAPVNIPNPTAFRQIEGFQNFLAHSAETFLNVKIENGEAEFEMTLEPYTTLMIAVVSDD